MPGAGSTWARGAQALPGAGAGGCIHPVGGVMSNPPAILVSATPLSAEADSRQVQLGRGERWGGDTRAIGAPDDEDAAVGEKRRGVEVASGSHRAGRTEEAGRGVKQLGRGETFRAAARHL